MFAAPTTAQLWSDRCESGASAALAAAPEGLSARRVERWIDLPPGAWQKRRLYALRLKADRFTHLGLRGGDLLIVEPGTTQQPGRIVVTRSSDGLSLKRIASVQAPERRMPTVLELPLRDRQLEHSRHERVVGTVIGLLRSTGTGALRPVAGFGARSSRKRAAAAPMESRSTSPPWSGTILLADLQQILEDWHHWVQEAEHVDASPMPSAPLLDRWRRLEHSLATLCECLARTHSDSLRRALDAEAQAVVAAIRNEMGR